MIIKFQLYSEQLDALHKVLKSDENRYGERDDTAYVRIQKVRVIPPDRDIHLDPKYSVAVPKYEVTLYVVEEFSQANRTPLEKLTRVLVALGLFVGEGKAPSK